MDIIFLAWVILHDLSVVNDSLNTVTDSRNTMYI